MLSLFVRLRVMASGYDLHETPRQIIPNEPPRRRLHRISRGGKITTSPYFSTLVCIYVVYQYVFRGSFTVDGLHHVQQWLPRFRVQARCDPRPTYGTAQREKAALKRIHP